MSKPVGKKETSVYVDVDNEQLILVAMMLDRVILSDLTVALNPDLFIGDRHKNIFTILEDIAARKFKFDIEIFEQLGRKKNYGGRKYIRKLLEAYPNPAKNIRHHVDKLRVDAIKFYLRIGHFQKLIDLSEDPNSTLDQFTEIIYDVSSELTSKIETSVKKGDDLYRHYLRNLRARRETGVFVPTGFDWLDESLTEGLARKKISIWAARPSMGKSTLLWNIAYRVAKKYGKKIGYFPYEMGEIAVLDGIVSLDTGIKLDLLVKSPQDLNKFQLKTINKCVKKITDDENLGFYTKGPLFEKLHNVIKVEGYDIVIMDLWEKLCPDLEQKTIALYLNQTQKLFQDTNCHGALVQQIRRGVEKRKDKRPTMEDLKNSGAYEEVADLIAGLYRDSYYDESLEEDILEIELMKQRRGGRLKTHYYKFEPEYGRIGDAVRDHIPASDYE
jgi:replicative DNA helicase